MQILKDYFQDITTKGGAENFLIINLDQGAYMQFAAAKGSTNIYCEASSNFFTNINLSPTQEQQLQQLGWQNNPQGNFTLDADIPNDVALDNLIHVILQTASVYHTPISNFKYEVNLN